jgi:hypothetical protein
MQDSDNRDGLDAPTDVLLREVMAGHARSLAQVAKLVPAGRGGRPTSPTTVWRWSRAGVKTADGRTVRLETMRIGGRYVTTEQALRRFLAAQQDAPATPAQTAPQATRRADDAAKVSRQLDAIGI